MIGVVHVLTIICVLALSCCILAKETYSHVDPVKDFDNTISDSKYDYVQVVSEQKGFIFCNTN